MSTEYRSKSTGPRREGEACDLGRGEKEGDAKAKPRRKIEDQRHVGKKLRDQKEWRRTEENGT